MNKQHIGTLRVDFIKMTQVTGEKSAASPAHKVSHVLTKFRCSPGKYSGQLKTDSQTDGQVCRQTDGP